MRIPYSNSFLFPLLTGATLCLIFASTGRTMQPAAKAASQAEETQSADVVVTEAKAEPAAASAEAIEVSDNDEHPARKEATWLGISAEEASDVLSSQLGLEPGLGLVVTYVATNSPAGKAGLRKNDVLVRFDDQSLVHPAQLRKLVRVHKEGDEVKLGYYRAGKKETATVTLGKTDRRFSWVEEEGDWQGDLRQLGRDIRELPIKEALKEQMHSMRQSLGNLKVDQRKVEVEVQRSMEEARKAMQEALHGMSNVDLGPVRKALEEMARSGVTLDNDASVTVRSSGKSTKSLVKTDDSGTIVLLTRPKLRLTAHDKDGRLIFDGEIQTDEQREKVPRDLWERVEPLLNKMNDTTAEEPEAQDTQ